MIARFRAWLTARLAWLDVMEDPGAIPEPVVDLCTCTPAAVGPRSSACPRCGGGVVYLSEHPTDTARREARDDLPSTADVGVVTDPKEEP